MSTSLDLPSVAWSKQEGKVFAIGLSEEIYDKIGSVIEVQFPELGTELLAGENLFTIAGTTEDFSLKAPVAGFFLGKNEDVLENFHFDHDNWIVKFEPE